LPIKAALTLKAGQTPTSAPDAVDTIAAKSYVA